MPSQCTVEVWGNSLTTPKISGSQRTNQPFRLTRIASEHQGACDNLKQSITSLNRKTCRMPPSQSSHEFQELLLRWAERSKHSRISCKVEGANHSVTGRTQIARLRERNGPWSFCTETQRLIWYNSRNEAPLDSRRTEHVVWCRGSLGTTQIET